MMPLKKLGIAADFAERLQAAIVRTCEKRNDVKTGDLTLHAPQIRRRLE